MYIAISQKQITELKIISQTLMFWLAIGLIGLAKFHLIKPLFV